MKKVRVQRCTVPAKCLGQSDSALATLTVSNESTVSRMGHEESPLMASGKKGSDGPRDSSSSAQVGLKQNAGRVLQLLL
jgi:hypothetical protein